MNYRNISNSSFFFSDVYYRFGGPTLLEAIASLIVVVLPEAVAIIEEVVAPVVESMAPTTSPYPLLRLSSTWSSNLTLSLLFITSHLFAAVEEHAGHIHKSGWRRAG